MHLMGFCLIMNPKKGAYICNKKNNSRFSQSKKRTTKKISLGNIYAVRDWGHAKDYAVSMWKILQYKKPDDWVIATNKETTVKDFVNKVTKKLDIQIKWVGKGLNEKAINIKSKKTIIEINKKYFRPTEVDYLKGNFSKAKKLLKWKPTYKTDDLIDDMINSELKTIYDK